MLHEVLKQSTGKQHDYLEQLMFVDKIMSGTLSAAEYKQILTTNYLVHAELEQQLFEGLSADLKAELHITNRYKLVALEKDLQEINTVFTEVKYNRTDAEIFQTDAAILGAMYVLEGATLGGNVIVKKLKVNQNLQDYHLNFHYYQVYGADLIAHWKQFCQILNTKVAAEDFETSVKSAIKTFDYFAAAQQESIAPNLDLQPEINERN